MINHIHFQKGKYILINVNLWFICYLFLVLLVSCKQKPPVTEHTEYLDEIIFKSDKLAGRGLTMRAQWFLDSAFSTIPNPSPLDLLKKHEAGVLHFYAKKESIFLTMLYGDSMILAIEDYKTEPPYQLAYLHALLLNGEIRLLNKNYPGAYKYYLKAKNYVEEREDAKLEAEFYRGMGIANYRVSEYIVAAKYIKQSLSLLPDSALDKSYNSIWTRQSLLNTIGLAFEKLLENDSAIVYYQRGCRFIEKNRGFHPDKQVQMETAKAVIMGNMIRPYYRMGNAQAAESIAKESLHYNQTLGYDKGDAQTAMLKLGRIYLEQNRLADAEAIIDTLKVSVALRAEPQNQNGLFELCSDYYEKKGDIEQAFVYFKKGKVLRAKLELESINRINIDLGKEIEDLERKDKVDLLTRKSEENTIIIILASAIVLLAIWTIILLWRNWKQSKKSVLSLTNLNNEIQSKNFQLERSIKLLEVSQTLGETAGWQYNHITNELFITKQTYLLYDLENDFTPTIESFRAMLSESESEIFDQITQYILKKEEPYHLVTEIITAKKNKKWVRIIAEPIVKDDLVIGSIGAIQDITVTKIAEQELLTVKEKLEQNILEKDQIMNMLIHDLISPLSGIRSLTDLLLDKNIFSSQDHEMLSVINKTSLLLVEMINDLVALYLSSENTLLKKDVNIKVLLEQCASIIKHKADEKSQQIFVNLEVDLIACVDSKKIHRALSNLVGNAIKFSPPKSTINLYAKKENGLLKLTVEDKGIGIPEELHNQLFDTFTKARRYGTEGEQPMGLGLSITKKIVEAHDGKIWFESKPDKGTIFFIEIPSN